MTRRALLDVDGLIALLDAGHLHHRAATARLAANLTAGRASCPPRQNGCPRTRPAAACANARSAAVPAERPGRAAAGPSQALCPDAVALLEAGAPHR